MLLSLIVHLHSLKWVIPAFVMLGNAPCFIVIWSACRILTAALPRRHFRQIDDKLYGFYKKLLLFFFENYVGLKVIVYGDVECLFERKENVIYLSNHQSTVDWVVACMLSVRQGSEGHLRYVMKDGLKFFPLYGFYFLQHGNLFVKRGGKFQNASFSRQLEYLKKNDMPVWLIIFPEGTRYNPELEDVINSSNEFIKERGLTELKNVLTPRARATQMSIKHLRDSVDVVYDVTIAYSNTYNAKSKQRLTSPGMPEFLTAVSPEVHVHIERISIDAVPEEDCKFKMWLHSRYAEKDRLLNHFYSDKEEENGRFPGESVEKNLNLRKTMPSFMFFGSLLTCALIIPQARSLYWKVGVFGTLAGIVWVSVKS